MTQQIENTSGLTEQQTAHLKMLQAKYAKTFIHFEDGDEMILGFDVDDITEGKSEKFGNEQVIFKVVDPNNPFTDHKLSMSSKKAIQAIMAELLEGNLNLRLKKSGQGAQTVWSVAPV